MPISASSASLWRWDSPSLCEAWRVRDVIGHMSVGYTTGFPTMLAKLARFSFNVPKASKAESIGFASSRTTAELLEVFDSIFQHVEGYEGLPDLAAVKAFVLSAQETAAAYARNYGGTVKEIRKAERVNKSFQQVLDDPEAEAALQQPALKPLLDEAAD